MKKKEFTPEQIITMLRMPHERPALTPVRDIVNLFSPQISSLRVAVIIGFLNIVYCAQVTPDVNSGYQ